MRISISKLDILSKLVLFSILSFQALISVNAQSNNNTLTNLPIASTGNLQSISLLDFTNNGISGASFAGGTEIMIQGPIFSPAESMTVEFQGLGSAPGPWYGPSPSKANAFKSSTLNGKLEYTTPSASSLTGVSLDSLIQEETFSFNIAVLDPAVTDFVTGGLSSIGCPSGTNCRLVMSRQYTPILYYLQPRVMFNGSEVDFLVDPKSAQDYRLQDSSKNAIEWPFTEARVNGFTVDFNTYVDDSISLSAYNINQVRGFAYQIATNQSADTSFKFRAGYAMHDPQSLVCSYDNKTCYEAKVVPSIEKVSASSGYISGGQTLTIQGFGFQGTGLSVLIDGAACTVQSVTNTKIVCITGAQPNPSSGSNFVGSQGIRRSFYNTTQLDGVSMSSAAPAWEILATSFETPQNVQDSRSGNIFKGFFKPPVTGKYRFYVSCDDSCTLSLSTSMDPSQKQLIFTSPSYSTYRNYFTADGSRQTAWKDLIGGNYYYIESSHNQWGWSDHMTVSVELDTNTLYGHQQSMKEIQRFQINPTNIREQSAINITNPDGGDITVRFYQTLQSSPSDPATFSTNATAAQVQSAIQGFWPSKPISVTRTMWDINGAVTTDVLQSVQTQYIITVNIALTADSFTFATSSKVTAGSNVKVSFVYPKDLKQSSAPLSGQFTFQCTVAGGQASITDPISANAQTWVIRSAIEKACPQYKDKFSVFDGPLYTTSYVDGRDFFIRFQSYNQDPAQLIIATFTNSPLAGATPISLSNTTFQPYSTNLMYEPIPFEWLYTNETTPQIFVTVNGTQAVCSSLKCGYSYTALTASISGFSLSGNTLTITGTSLTTTGITVEFAKQVCTVSSPSTSTQIVCTIPSTTAGSWYPIVTDSNGQITVASGVLKKDISLSVTSVNQTTGLNNQGGNTLLITGTNFPASLAETSTVTITLPDGSSCVLKSSSVTQMVCLTNQYSGAVNSPVSLTVTVNGQTDSSKTLTFVAAPAQVVSIWPTKASPVLTTNITLQLNSNFAGAISIADLTATIQSKTNSSLFKRLSVIDVDTTNKRVVLKYNGIDSGTYKILLSSYVNGIFDTTSVTFTAIGIITDFSPNAGSVYGGTLITINGYNFSNNAITDNAVQIGNTYCDVISTSNSQIICRTQARQNVDDSELTVYLRTFEQAVCQAGLDCSFTWKEEPNLPEVFTPGVVTFDTTLNDFVLTLQGSFYISGATGVELYVDGVSQVVTSATSSQITFTLSGFRDTSSYNIQFYLPTGIPKGASQLISSGIKLAPTVLSISPSTGSPAGSIITAIVKGVGVNTANVAFVTSGSTTNICSSVTIPSYGVVQCKTNVATFSATTLSVKVGSSSSITCATAASCAYQTSSSFPAVSSQAISGNTIVFTGTNFFTSNYVAQASLNGINADTVSIDSATKVAATWTLGVPVISGSQIPSLWFNGSATSSGVHWASNTNSLTNALTVAALDSSVTCSFNGGCTVSLAQAGLSSAVKQGTASLSICGNQATLLSSSTSTNAYFSLPSLSTVYSNLNYNISQPSNLIGTPFSSESKAAVTNAPFDGSTVNGFQSSQSTCYFGTAFRPGYIGVISQVKYWMNAFVQASMVGKLSFQGSQDDITYTTIFTVGNEIHEGWNYYDFTGTSILQYRYYRFYSTSGVGTCNVGEVGLLGVEVINNNISSYACTPQLVLNGGSPVNLTGTITYQGSSTPLLTSIYPRFGQVQGGDSITFTGTGFSSDKTQYTIILDGINCQAQTATSTSVTCLTGKRPGLVPTSTVIIINGKGSVSTNGLVFRYVNYWSNTQTWGLDFAPMDGESVVIPKGLNLLVDIDVSPQLNAIVVEGSLIFPPHSDATRLRTFDAKYIMVKGGYLEIGTEQFPYTSRLTITMHGQKTDPELPIFGNKVIAVYEGTLEIHGVPRNPTWTELLKTANKGDTQITLNTAVDWQPNEVIVIAPTGYDNTETDVRTIVSVNRNNPNQPILTLNQSLSFSHYAGIDTYTTTDFIEMRAEVALLTRNILYRGDPETSPDAQFGAHIMLHGKVEKSVLGRIEYAEFQYVGQAFQVGRYPLHFHMIGDVSNSYIRGNSIHNTYNRAVTIHGVHYLRIIRNVAFMTKGHTFFIEDAVETKNIIQENLAIRVHASWSLLNTDTTPACFWITHPDNIFKGNHAVGADRYGYWFDTKPHSTGPSASDNVCPENSQLGEFTNNVAHSNLKYGLRIFHKLIPRQNPCSPLIYDPTNTTDPYWKNPLVTANFINFTSWKNLHDGAIFEQIGDVRFINFKVADNLIAGIEVSLTKDTMDGKAQIINALVIGTSANSDSTTMSADLRGIITPRTENFQVNGARFFNFPQQNHAAFGTCSHCFHPAATDSGARTITTSQLYFNSSVTRRIIYQYPQRDIFYDIDGTFTGLGANTWATFFYPHNNQSECQVNDTVYNGLICNSKVQIRRIAFYGQVPWMIFTAQPIDILQYDDTITSKLNSTQLQSLIKDTSQYSIIPFKNKQDPSGWAIPFVTGHKYKVSWGSGPLDWTKINIDQSSRWQKSDSDVYLVMNFTDARARVNVTAGGKQVDNCSMLFLPQSSWSSGDYALYNDTSIRELHVVFNGKDLTRTKLVITGERCVGPCIKAINTTPIENTTRRWSDPKSWTSGKIPVAGDNVTIESGWNMLYDVAVSPIINYLEINGRLTFEDGVKDLQLNSYYIFVRAGELLIGNETNPFQNNAEIVLYGDPSTQTIVFNNAIEAGNKVLANTNLIKFFGKQRQKITRLTASAQLGQRYISVEPGLDLVKDDRLAVAPTGMIWNDTDYVIVTAYDSTTGMTSLDRPLSAYHYGDPVSNAKIYGIDMRAEVQILSRNIRIKGDTLSNSWGCSILTSDFPDGLDYRSGSTIMDSVEVYNCSQYDTLKAALRFDGNTGSYSSITNSSIYLGWGMGITIIDSNNTFLQNNNIFSFVRFGVLIKTSFNITLDGNVLNGVWDRGLIALDHFVDISGGIIGCADDKLYPPCQYSLTNNIAIGSSFSGFATYGYKCGLTKSNQFRGNIAHSNAGTGAVIFRDPLDDSQEQCMEASYFSAYKNQEDGAVSLFATQNINYKHMLMIDNAIGPSPMIGYVGDNLNSNIENITIWGETPARDCSVQNECLQWGAPGCFDRIGLMIPYFQSSPKDAMPTMKSSLPIHHIKGDAPWGGKVLGTNIQFKGFFSSTTWCGNKQVVFGLNADASDYQPRLKLINPVFENVTNDAVAFLFSPKWGWANPDDCGNWPCSAPNNTFIKVLNQRSTGVVKPTLFTDDSFAIAPNNAAAVSKFSGCSFVKSWNGYYCNDQDQDLGILLFESLDSDKYMRMITPISVVDTSSGANTTINTFMDHIWDGFYTGQIRLSRWPAIIQVGSPRSPAKTYMVKYSGTPPLNQRFTLITDSGSGIQVDIDYTKPGVYNLKDSNGNLIKANAWNDTLKNVNPLIKKQDKCGENRYVGVTNILSFWLTPGCLISIVPIDAIASSIRLQWTLSEFYADGGATTFSDRLGSSLGIKPQDIKVVAVYQGSVIVQFEIIPTSSSTTEVQTNLVSGIQKNSLNLGAPILSADVSSQPVVISTTNSGSTSTGGNTPTNPGTNSNNNKTNTTDNNGGQKIVTITTTGTTTQVINNSGSSTGSSNNLTLIIILGVIAAVIIIGAVIGYVLYKRCQKQTIQTDRQVRAPGEDHNGEAPSPTVSSKG